MAKQPTRRQPKVREVTLFLMNAAEISAVVSAFSPVKKKLRVELREPWGHREPGRYKLKIDQIACVAFPRPKGVPPSKPADQPGLHEYKVHIVGGIQFSVRVKSAQLDNPVGFWGRAVVENHPFPKVFFYRHGVEVIEEAQRLGSLLVKQGAVDSEQLRRGLEAQRQVRSRLVERRSGSARAHRRAATRSVHWIRRGWG